MDAKRFRKAITAALLAAVIMVALPSPVRAYEPNSVVDGRLVSKGGNYLLPIALNATFLWNNTESHQQWKTDYPQMEAWDLQAPEGTPVKAITSGTVVSKVVCQDEAKGQDCEVWVKHTEKNYSAYIHLQSVRVQLGDSVTEQSVLGLVGKQVGEENKESPPHLHFEMAVAVDHNQTVKLDSHWNRTKIAECIGCSWEEGSKKISLPQPQNEPIETETPVAVEKQVASIADLPFVKDRRADIPNATGPSYQLPLKPEGIMIHQIVIQLAGKDIAKELFGYEQNQMDGGSTVSGYQALVGQETMKVGDVDYAIAHWMRDTAYQSWHAAIQYNPTFLSIAYQDVPAEAAPSEVQLRTILAVTKVWMQQFNIPANKVLGHKEAVYLNSAGQNTNSKRDPVGVDMDQFRKELESTDGSSSTLVLTAAVEQQVSVTWLWPVDPEKCTAINVAFGEPNDAGGQPHHTGIDRSCGKGIPVQAVADGTVIFTGRWPVEKTGDKEGHGNIVAIQHGVVNGKPLISISAHLNTIEVQKGQTIKAGQQIGTVGETGAATGPHLHFAVLNSQWSDNWIEWVEGANNPWKDPYLYMGKAVTYQSTSTTVGTATSTGQIKTTEVSQTYPTLVEFTKNLWQYLSFKERFAATFAFIALLLVIVFLTIANVRKSGNSGFWGRRGLGYCLSFPVMTGIYLYMFFKRGHANFFLEVALICAGISLILWAGKIWGAWKTGQGLGPLEAPRWIKDFIVFLPVADALAYCLGALYVLLGVGLPLVLGSSLPIPGLVKAAIPAVAAQVQTATAVAVAAPTSVNQSAWEKIALAASKQPPCDPALIYGLWWTETKVIDCSDWKDSPGANACRSPAGAMGPLQFMPGTWPTYAEAGWDVWDLGDATQAACKMVRTVGLPNQTTEDGFVTRFTGADNVPGGPIRPVWNQDSPQAHEVWRIWQSLKK